MTLRHRLALWFTAITAVLFALFSLLIYFSAAQNREKEFYALLKKEGVTKAQLVLSGRIEPAILQDIYRNNRQILDEVEVAMYDTTFALLYHDAVDVDVVKETPEMLALIIDQGTLRFKVKDYQAVGFVYSTQNKKFLITAAAYDQYGYAKLRNLRNTLLLSLALALLTLYWTGKFFAGRALRPVADITEKARKISATSLHLRLDSGNRRDELARLAHTFNDMLERLEKSFEAQKSFVFHIAHELRTPLAALMTEAELALSRPRSDAEWKEAVTHILEDARRLSQLVSHLLDLAKASYDPAGISFKPEAPDEILTEAAYELTKNHPDYKVDFIPSSEECSPEPMQIMANAYLLRVAFLNLMENGCKFSPDHTCRIRWKIFVHQDQKSDTVAKERNSAAYVDIFFENSGPGIPAEDLPHIFEPFYRGSTQSRLHTGYGIGLSLSQKIIQLHKGRLDVESQPGLGAVFTVRLPLIFFS
ncbi:MAG: ATP-binding protein [Flavobacteriales bacterium]|nr:ATP-binding protein [Flavobacteriales bacterium]